MAVLDWVKKVDAALLALDEKPQFGLPSDFPIDQLQNLLSKLFERPGLTLSHTQKGWMKSGQLFDGLGENISTLAIDWTPIEVPIYFVVSEQDLKELMSDLLGGEKAATPFYEPALAEGFFHYLALEMLQCLEGLKYLAPLSPRITDAPTDVRAELQNKQCFVCDVSLVLKDKTIWGRLLVPEAFRHAWKTQFPHFPQGASGRNDLPVEIGLEVGHTQLSLQEWKSIKTGDFLLLDHCSYNPDEKKGGVTLRLGEEPIFRGRFKSGGIKISDYPLYEEGNKPMDSDMEEEVPEFMDTGESLEGGFVSKGHDFEKLPVQLSVEVGRVQMSLKDLKDLSPGNLLELGVAPEQGVDLIVNGKKIGRGELIRMGEALGVRILSF